MGLVARGSAFTHSDMRLYILTISKLTCHPEEWAPASLYFNREVIAICFFKVVGGAYWS